MQNGHTIHENGSSTPEVDSKYTDIPWKEFELDIGWGVIRGKQICNDGPNLLAVHGWLDNANSFDLIAPYLNSYNIVAIDLPGHGKSDHFKGGFIYDPRGYMGAVKKIIDKLGWKKFIYVGHSMGALVGIKYTATFKEDIEVLVSIDIISIWAYPFEKYAASLKKYYLDYFKQEDLSEKDPIAYTHEELVKKSMISSKSLDEKCAAILLERGSKPSDCETKRILTRDTRAKAYFIGFITNETWIHYLKEITCPTLVIKANHGHLYKPEDNHEAEVAAFQENSKHFELLKMDGKHHLHMSHAHQVGPKILDFIKTHYHKSDENLNDTLCNGDAVKFN